MRSVSLIEIEEVNQSVIAACECDPPTIDVQESPLYRVCGVCGVVPGCHKMLTTSHSSISWRSTVARFVFNAGVADGCLILPGRV